MMRLHDAEVEDTFAEAFGMWGARIVVTADTPGWAEHAARSLTGFATSVIGCKCEAGVERELEAEETPDGRPGVAVLLFAPVLHHVRGQVEALGLHALVRDLCQATHAVAVTLRHERERRRRRGRARLADRVPVSRELRGRSPALESGRAERGGGARGGEADAALVVGSDPLEHLPQGAADRMRSIPVVLVDTRGTATADAARVAFTTAAAGVHRPASCTGSTACRSRCASCSSRRVRATRTYSRRSPGGSRDAAHRQRARLRPRERGGWEVQDVCMRT